MVGLLSPDLEWHITISVRPSNTLGLLRCLRLLRRWSIHSTKRGIPGSVACLMGTGGHFGQRASSLVFAAATWGAGWAGHHVSFHVDNMAVVAVIQRRCAKDDLLTHFLRCLCFYGAYFHFEFSAIHIPGACNTAADASSRNNLPLFSSLFPQVTMVPLPLRVLNLILHQQPKWTSPAWIELFRASLLRVSHPPHNPPN